MSMSKGGYRPNSGRKKGSIPWNKGIHSGNHGNGFKKGQISWNKDIKSGNHGNGFKEGQIGARKGIPNSPETRLKLSKALKGRVSPWKGKTPTIETRKQMRQSHIERCYKTIPNYSYRPEKDRRKYNMIKNGGHHSRGEWENLKAQYNFICPSCKRQEPEIKLTRDHIIPIAKGGSDNIENIQPLCISCNVSKNTTTIKY